MDENIKIRQIKYNEIPFVKDFPPDDWQLDLSVVYKFHYGKQYFCGLVAIVGNIIAGTGMSILNKDAAWLGTIIVKEEFRKLGIGKAITKELINWSKNKGADKILLCATDMGRSLYDKLGFRQSMNYLVFKDGCIPESSDYKHISSINSDDINKILKLDREASGEDRKRIIQKTYKSGYKYVFDNRISGFYLPDFGNGLIIAENKIAGLELFKFRNLKDKSKVVVPEKNDALIEFLRENDFKEHNRITRMYLGSEVNWKQEMIYNRGCGYMG